MDPSYGKGGAIREGIKLALSEATPDDIIGFQEPEKVNMLSIYPDIINQMHKNSLCILKRSSDSFSTLPKEQLYLEKYVNCFMEKVTSYSYDWTFGPILFYYNCAEYFLNCKELKMECSNTTHNKYIKHKYIGL